MDKKLVAILLTVLVMSIAFDVAYANTSHNFDFSTRKQHKSGWHNSPVCGLEICSGKTGALTFQGMTADGTKPPQIRSDSFNGKYYLKGAFNSTG